MCGVLLILQLLLLVCEPEVVLCEVHLKPRSVTVLRGAAVRFNCSTNEPWEVMVWQLNGRTALTISAQHGPLGSNDRFWALNHSTLAISMWEFILKSSTFSPEVQEVICELLPDNVHRLTANLSVQEEGSVMVVGGNVSAQVGALIALECQAAGWFPDPAVSWSVNDAVVENSEFNHSSIQESTGLFNVTSILQLRVEQISRVECVVSVSALPAPHTSAVFVSAVPPGNDSTLVIAVSVAMCIIAVLVLITVLFFCRHTWLKSKVHRDEVRFDQQDSVSNPYETGGKVNLGYHAEGPTGPGPPVPQSSGLSHPHHGVTVTTAGTQKVPDIIYIMSHEPRQDIVTDYVSPRTTDGPRKIRQTTTV